MVSTNETLGTGSNEFQQKGSENERQARQKGEGKKLWKIRFWNYWNRSYNQKRCVHGADETDEP